jgi:pyridoxine 4-dehydrogenase
MASHGDAPGEPARVGTACPGGPGLIGGRTVARVGYGAMQLRHLRHDPGAAIALLRRAVELGVTHVDTAQFYGDGFVNEIISEAIGLDAGVTVVSKVGADPDPGGQHPLRMAQRPEELAASVDANLATLGLEQIPVVNLRRPGTSTPIPVEENQVVDLDDQLAAMIALREAGKIGAIGLSSVTLDELRRSLPAGIACVQNAYSLVSRTDEDMLRLCTGAGIAWVPYFPLGGALPGLPKVTEEPAVLAAAGSLRCTPAQVGLAWLLGHAPNVLLIPGTASADHLEANLAAGALSIDAATLAALDAVPSRDQPQLLRPSSRRPSTTTSASASA